tara:strand:- start:1215 stop:1415 length:201 start_codon:yes stop_codon:yes gene_type:complete
MNRQELVGNKEFLSYIANEAEDGAIQALFNEDELEQGKHYSEAIACILNLSDGWLVEQFEIFSRNR